MEYTFTLKYQLVEDEIDPEALVECLAEAGCDDALVGIGQPGRLVLEFTREAVNARTAVYSALADVKKAIPSVKLIEAFPDFVGLTDVADIVGISRQAMRKLMITYQAEFPTPVHEGRPSIWHLAEILDWLEGRGGYQFDQSTLEVARVILELNLVKESNKHSVTATRKVEGLAV